MAIDEETSFKVLKKQIVKDPKSLLRVLSRRKREIELLPTRYFLPRNKLLPLHQLSEKYRKLLIGERFSRDLAEILQSFI